MTITISLPEAEERLAEKRRAAEEIAADIEALSMITEGLRRLNGHAGQLFPETRIVHVALPEAHTERENKAHPVGRAAVREIVGERPGLWSLRDITNEAVRRGWATNRKPIEVAVHRMTKAGEARRVSHGRYRFGPDTEVDSP
jgi:hypothetical protein